MSPAAATLSPRFLGILLALAFAACAPPSEPHPDTAAQVEETLDRYLTAISARDTTAIRNVMVPDGRVVWLENGEIRYRSVDEVLASVAALAPDAPLETRVEGLEVVPVGVRGAHAWARFETTVGSGEEGFSFAGVFSFVLERVDDRWRIVGGHSS